MKPPASIRALRGALDRIKLLPHTPGFTENTPGPPTGIHHAPDIHIHTLVRLSEKPIVSGTPEHKFTMMGTEPITALENNATGLIAEVNAARKPMLITQSGVPAAYLVDAATYESMETRIQLLEGIAKGEQAISKGLVVSHEEARQRMSKWLAGFSQTTA